MAWLGGSLSYGKLSSSTDWYGLALKSRSSSDLANRQRITAVAYTGD
jgi:hypothetical protein